MTAYDPKAVEPEMLQFWEQNGIYRKLREKLARGRLFYFLDGPPYTTGAIHVGHAWNKSLKDCFIRAKRMAGFNVIDTPGFDMHGLPIEVKVEEKLGITSKQEIIEKVGLQRFIRECEQFALDNLHPMVKDFKRLGIWMDWDAPYMTIRNEYIEGAWWALKAAANNGFLYRGQKVMTACPRCATALAKHELEYETVEEPSIFVKLPVVDRKGEFLLIWTTTPWTLPFNLAVMVNPDLDYLKVKVDGEVWYIAEALATAVVTALLGKRFEILQKAKGRDLAGIRYRHPFLEELPDQQDYANNNPKAHTVVLSEEYVTTEAGTGLVHCAPGCGPEDYEVGKRNGLPAYNAVDEHGVFPKQMGPLAGWAAKKDDRKFIGHLQRKGLLLAESPVKHEYAHCWRCHSPVIFRSTSQWFLAVEKLKEQMLRENQKINWTPDWAGQRWFNSWLRDLQDWCISRQRFWGIPLPIWLCTKCPEYRILASRHELKEATGKDLKDLHRPWIDEVTLPCKCGGELRRVPDVLDVWLDSGAAPWAALQYPARKDWERYGAMDFIIEGKDQIRGWFNSLMALGMASQGRPSYRAVYMHGMILDGQGRKMSKSLGNVISPYEVVDKWGADTMRAYMIGGTNPGLDLNYNFKDMEVKHRNLQVLWNLHKFLIDLCHEAGMNPYEQDTRIMESLMEAEEQVILSKLHTAIQHYRDALELYRLNELPAIVEDVFLALSREYIQLTREKAAGEDKQLVAWTVSRVLLDCLRLYAPVAPFITERIYQDLRQAFQLRTESIHLHDLPAADKRLANPALERQYGIARQVIEAALYCREKARLNVRWPVKSIEVETTSPAVEQALEQLGELIKRQVNAKELHPHAELPQARVHVQPSPGAIGHTYKERAPDILKALASMKPEQLAKHLREDRKVVVKLIGREVELGPEHFTVTRELPQHLIEAEFKAGRVFLDTTRTDELDAEGYAREITRRVQALRKEAGLEKQQRVALHLQVDDDLARLLKDWHASIAEKCGAHRLHISTQPPGKKPDQQAEETIKGHKVLAALDVLRNAV
jgi:isoleucyl-tRNA synthetase